MTEGLPETLEGTIALDALGHLKGMEENKNRSSPSAPAFAARRYGGIVPLALPPSAGCARHRLLMG